MIRTPKGATDETKFMAFLVLSAVATRLYSLFNTKGYLDPDHLFQILEPAHKVVFGYGMAPWEFVLGQRPWLQPLIVSIIFKIGTLLGIGDIYHLIFLNRTLATLFSLALLYVTYQAARALYNRIAALYALFFAVFSGVLVWWGADVDSHIPAALYTTTSLLLFFRGCSDGGRRQFFLSGLALGVAFMFRFDSFIFLLPIGLFAIAYREFRWISPFAAGLSLALLLQGVLDYLTWGSFLHSPYNYVMNDFSVLQQKIFGSMPFYYYIGVLGLHLTCLMVLPFAFEKRRAFAFLSLSASVFIIVFSLLPPKDIRYVIQALPPFFIICGRGMERAVEFYGRGFSWALLSMTVVLCVAVATGLGFQSNWAESRAMNFVGRQADAAGVAYEMPWSSSGGYTYLHRKIPMISLDTDFIDPMLKPAKCGYLDTSLIEFQCGDIEEVLGMEKINYFVVVANGTIEGRIRPDGFEKMSDFDGMVVYRRP